MNKITYLIIAFFSIIVFTRSYKVLSKENSNISVLGKSDLESIEIMQNSIKDMSIDNRSLHKLNNIDFGEIRKYRAIIYNLWEKYTLDNGLHPVYNKLINNIIPWNYSAYASDLDERNKWLDWGFKNNISVYTWPRLPISFIDEKNNVLDRWNRLICFPIVQKMSLKKLKNIFR